MKDEPLAAAEAVALLRENASRLAALTERVSRRRLHAAPEPDEWSPSEILAHVRACSDVWGGNIVKILDSAQPTFPGVNPRTWIKRTDYPDWPFDKALRAFTAQRAELLSRLDALAPRDWERSATVTAYGQANRRTLRSYASQLAEHERTHVQQIERAVTPAPEVAVPASRSSLARTRRR